MSTCAEVRSDVYAFIEELAITQVEHKSETHSNESQHLAEGTEGTRLRRRFSFVLHQALSLRTRHHLCRQGVALASPRQFHSQGPVSVRAHRTKGETGSERREGANMVGGRTGVGGGNGDGNGVGGGNGDVNGDGDGDGGGTRWLEENKGTQCGNGAGSGDGVETGMGTRVETKKRTQDGNGDGSGDENESSNRDGNGDED